ncbi:MAG: hypothetical protein LBM61_03150 [Prevotellaceae bacterium]|jgi:outer membrane lipoprotein-sorting protein|nr:hypothetical protein [Prevotellaceae bacterium]
MRCFLFLISLYLFSCLSVTAQNAAESLLDKAASAYEQNGGTEVSFTYEWLQQSQTIDEGQGQIKLQGDKWMLNMPGTLTWNDGNTQWVLSKANEEVYISEANATDAEMYNPYAYFTLHRKGYKAAIGKDTSFQGKQITSIVLSGRTIDTFKTVTLYINKEYCPVFISYQTQEGDYQGEIVVKTYQTNAQFPAATFVFDAKQYPDAEIIDMR